MSTTAPGRVEATTTTACVLATAVTTTTACVADKGSVRRAAAEDQLFGPDFLGHKQWTEMYSRTVYRVTITDSVQGDTETV